MTDRKWSRVPQQLWSLFLPRLRHVPMGQSQVIPGGPQEGCHLKGCHGMDTELLAGRLMENSGFFKRDFPPLLGQQTAVLMICNSRWRVRAHCKFLQSFCLTESPGDSAAGVFLSKLIHNWSHILPVSSPQVTEASRASLQPHCLTPSRHAKGSPAANQPPFPPRPQGTPSQRAEHTAERGWEAEKGLWGSSPGKGPTSGWILWGCGKYCWGIKGNLWKLIFCDKKGNIVPPRFPASHSVAPEEESSRWASRLVSEL